MAKGRAVKDFLSHLNARLAALDFAPYWVYNPWEYAGAAYLEYWERYAQGPKQWVLLGMNPGPWGMTQTGVPFGEVDSVRNWLAIRAPIEAPARQHPQRPIQGWDCARSEVSGRRLWGFLRQRYQTPDRFFRHHFVANYCPLVFLESGGRNLTPDKLPRSQREPLLELCDQSLLHHLQQLRPHGLIGVGKWAEERARGLVERHHLPLKVTSVPHPSPANPAANRGWGSELAEILGEP